MIKVNLLEGAADTRAATRATKAAAKTTQQLLMIAGGLLTLLIALTADYLIASERQRKAKEDLALQQQIAAKLKADLERKTELERQIKNVQERIKVIDDLQKTQQGPSKLIDLINSKMPPPSQGIRLDKITQVKDQLTIIGSADNPDIISSFASGLELGSDGLFQQVGLNVARKDREEPDPEDPTIKRLVTAYEFTISTKYTPTLVGQPAPGAEPEQAKAK